MRDVSAKIWTLRTAVARARLLCSPESIRLIEEDRAPKGDPRPVARVAAILAAKNTPQWIPYCHNVSLDWVEVEFNLGQDFIEVQVSVRAIYKTGVEMEALTAAAAAALNLYDLLKPVDRDLKIESIELLRKTGGKSNARQLADSAWRGAVLVCSDRASSGEYSDASGPILMKGIAEFGGELADYQIGPDDPSKIQSTLRGWTEAHIDVILVSGGTGISSRDTTPEAVAELLDRRLPGIEERFRSYSMDRTPLAMFSRAVAGIRKSSIIVTLPGSPSAAEDAIDCLFPYLLHAPSILRGDGH
ncbi:MAG TPA: bifunctional molybdenum cofactor biosynthesis protein MoaC/MoaB [Fimbriimonadaceae bacterium]|nr:bifunctional molybdenum cofactor biosynthesis protein MoaC/MoaB [Fimbriimonadaceae bacterium]